MERGTCQIAALYLTIINVLSLTLITVVGQQWYKFYHSAIVIVLGHVTSSVKIRSGWFSIGGPLCLIREYIGGYAAYIFYGLILHRY